MHKNWTSGSIFFYFSFNFLEYIIRDTCTLFLHQIVANLCWSFLPCLYSFRTFADNCLGFYRLEPGSSSFRVCRLCESTEVNSNVRGIVCDESVHGRVVIVRLSTLLMRLVRQGSLSFAETVVLRL